MYDRTGFLSYFADVVGASSNTCATYRSFLNRIDEAVSGLDEMLARKGLEGSMEWARTAEVEPFSTYRSHARSVLKRYAMYRLDRVDTNEADEPVTDIVTAPVDPSIETDANFIREKEMQVQVRRQLVALEAGLIAIDEGAEAQVATGRIDILARDASGGTVVIELKAGKCPAGALEQLLAYAYDVEQEKGTGAVRAMLVAGSFSDRQRAAAKRAGIELRTYAYSLTFQADD
jgi:RecB family endonuclease NucS